MNDNPQKVFLCDLTTMIKRGISPVYTENGIPVFNQKCIRDSRVNLDLRRKTDPEKRKISDEKLVKLWDVLINSTGVGTLGRMAQIKNNIGISTVDTHVTIARPDLKKVDGRYFGYALNAKQSTIEAMGVGATGQTELSRIRLGKEIAIPIPPLSTQHKISSILSAYDDLFENNTRCIQILEEMAQLIYKEWFVNFKYPGYENDQLVDSELGMIPKGWDINNIGDFIQYHIGGGWGKEELSEEFDTSGYVIRGTDIPLAKHGSIIKCPYRYHKSSNMKSRELKTGDIVFEVSGGSKDQPLGRALLINKELLNSFSDKVMCASFCKLIRPSNFSEYIYLHLLDIYRNREIMKYQVQSTGISNFKFQTFHDGHKIIKPTRNILDEFTELVSPIFSQMQILGKNNNNLRQTRDLLLPKLISGKIDVSNLDIDTSILYD